MYCVCVFLWDNAELLCLVLQLIVFAPETIPYHYLGAFGTFCRYLVDNYADLMYKG